MPNTDPTLDLRDAITAQNALTQVVSNKITSLDQTINQFVSNWGINGYTRLEVGANKAFPTIQAAWESLDGKSLKADVLIKVEDGIYPTISITLQNQAFGHRIRIEGNVANPSACQIKFTPDGNKTSHGWIIRNVRGLQLAGFTLVGEATASNWTYRCLLIENHAQVLCDASSLVLKGAVTGLEVNTKSIFSCQSLQISNCCEWGATINSGAQAWLEELQISGLGKSTRTPVPVALDADNTQRISHGLLVQDGAQCWSSKARISQVAHGILAQRNAYAWCDGTVIDQVEYGFYAVWNAVCWTHGRPISNTFPQGLRARVTNATLGYRADRGGVIWAPWATAENCTTGFQVYSRGEILANDGWAKNCTTGFVADALSEIEAYNTRANSTGCATLYNPGTESVLGNRGSLIRFS